MPGERVLLLGPSGSGKSTLFLTLTGLIPRTIPALVNGTIKVHGEDATSREPWGWVGDVAHLFQDADKTVCGMRVEDELAFALENRAMDPLRIETAITSAMEQVGLPESWRLRRTSTLSGGERQLVALAATLIQGAAFLLADEPTPHLAGKSTLGRALAGLLPLKAGQRTGPVGGYAFQRPENQFTTGSVREELASVLRWSSGSTRSS